MIRPVCAAALLALALPAPGAAAACDSLPPTQVRVTTDVDRPYIENRYSYLAITRRAAALARPGRSVLGLTEVHLKHELRLRSETETERPSGRGCLRAEIEVRLALSPFIIYVGNEFAPSSCAYDEILAHEQRHADTYRRYLAQEAAELEALLTRRFAGPARELSAGQLPWAGKSLQNELTTTLSAFTRDAEARVEKAQAAIDSPEEYARVGKACGGEIRRQIEGNGERRRE